MENGRSFDFVLGGAQKDIEIIMSPVIIASQHLRHSSHVTSIKLVSGIRHQAFTAAIFTHVLFVAVVSFPCDVCCFLIGRTCRVCRIWLDRVVVRSLIYQTRFCLQDRHDQSANRLKNNNTKRHKEMTRLVPTGQPLCPFTSQNGRSPRLTLFAVSCQDSW